jgi:hypothetical protein
VRAGTPARSPTVARDEQAAERAGTPARSPTVARDEQAAERAAQARLAAQWAARSQ